jgi:AraC family transcriptional regulator of adaptative response / DNA-3-methyladenine glycosylase II
LGRWVDPGALKQKLLQIRGIGPWTASYIAMRGLGDPDEFLHSDLVLLKAARALYGDASPRQLLDRAKAWRPWRAYAAMHLWQAASTQAVGAAD